MNNNLQDLIRISRLFGSDPSFVIAGGGNTSYKNVEMIWIKASGSSLATIDESGFVSLSREKLKIVAHKEYSLDPLLRENEVKADLHEAIVSPKTLRPSVETSLHELIGYSYVVHTHPTKVNGVMCSMKAKEACSEMFGEKALFIPYTDPGYILFKVVAEGIRKYASKFGRDPQVIFLENHGVFVGADTTSEIESIYAEMMDAIALRLSHQLPGTVKSEFHSVVTDRLADLHPGFAGFVASSMQSELIDSYTANSLVFEKAN